jgi:hypothetical protein
MKDYKLKLSCYCEAIWRWWCDLTTETCRKRRRNKSGDNRHEVLTEKGRWLFLLPLKMCGSTLIFKSIRRVTSHRSVIKAIQFTVMKGTILYWNKRQRYYHCIIYYQINWCIWFINEQKFILNEFLWDPSIHDSYHASHLSCHVRPDVSWHQVDVRPQVTWQNWRNCGKYKSLKICLIHFKLCAPSSLTRSTTGPFFGTLGFSFFQGKKNSFGQGKGLEKKKSPHVLLGGQLTAYHVR